MLSLNDGRSELWQWDTGRTLSVDADCSQVHFSNKVFGRSIDVDVANGVAIIPDILLQTDKDLNVWAFVGTAENGYTKISKTFKVIRRNKPADYVFTPQEQITLKDATAILEEAKDVAHDAMETSKKAEASADKAAKIADEMKKLADQVGQNADTATKAKADALTAQAKAEEARNAAETAKKAAEEAASNAGNDASAASAAATRAQNAANDAAAALDSIQVLYQEMQEYVSHSIQNIQTEGNTQVQRVSEEGTAQISSAKEQADRAQSEADRAEAARSDAEDTVESCIPDDTAVDGKPWTSKKIVDSLCQPFEESGNPVVCYPVAGYPLGVKAKWEPMQEGSGTQSPENIRPIKGRDSVTVNLASDAKAWRLITLDGTEGWVLNSGKYFFVQKALTHDFPSVNETGYSNDGICTQFIYVTDYSGRAIFFSKIGELFVGTRIVNEYKSVDAWKSYLAAQYAAGTPVQIAYKLARTAIAPEDGAIYFAEKPAQSGSGDPSPTNIRPILLDSAVQDGSTNTLTLPETVYGGEVDAVTGEGKRTWQVKSLDGTEGWAIRDSYIGVYNLLSPTDSGNGICTHFNVKRDYSGDCLFITDDGTIYLGRSLGVKYTVDTWRAYLAAQNAAGTPVQICYKLAEPVPFTATGAQPIPALSGVNTIYTDADGVVVTGAEDPKHTITELKNAIISLGGNV